MDWCAGRKERGIGVRGEGSVGLCERRREEWIGVRGARKWVGVREEGECSYICIGVTGSVRWGGA